MWYCFVLNSVKARAEHLYATETALSWNFSEERVGAGFAKPTRNISVSCNYEGKVIQVTLGGGEIWIRSSNLYLSLSLSLSLFSGIPFGFGFGDRNVTGMKQESDAMNFTHCPKVVRGHASKRSTAPTPQQRRWERLKSKNSCMHVLLQTIFVL